MFELLTDAVAFKVVIYVNNSECIGVIFGTADWNLDLV